MHVRTCPDCGEEFRPEIVRCSDCGAELRDADDEAASESHRDEPSAPGPAEAGEYATVFSAIESGAMRDAAAALARAGVTFRAAGNAAGFQLLVRSDDRALAIQALGGREGAVVDGPHSEGAPGRDGGACPACATPLRPGLLECPECGLVLGEQEGVEPGDDE